MSDEITNEHLAILENVMKEKDNKINELAGYTSNAMFNQQQ